MGHEDKGHFAAKHQNKKIDKTIAEKIQALADDNCLTCSAAHRAGKALNVSPSEIGVQTDLLEYQITECQLGLYGFSDGEKKINPNIEISPDLNEQLDKAAENDRISCLECWNIAKNLKMKRIDVSSACEKKNIKIKPCQLGAF
ncbi:hypothetical protein [Desulfobacula phenolica]|uniref:Uncharacterized protein n=1 Tax=Desulfobacula phenolica TaxID=90732 RepID=A0A1H2JW94_9BACT|nr:hypothetical protein [Desulfobacula phenolica]SDU60448.1 hypothetical protein SAMN04487931_11635 [Desulfobacula phenolica]